MTLLAMISPLGLLLLAGVGWLVLRVMYPRPAEGRAGGKLRFLGIVAVVAGLAAFLSHADHGSQEVRDSTDSQAVSHFWNESDSLPARWQETYEGEIVETVHRPARWVFIILGTALVILGVLVFGRGGTRPLAVKAMTVLGVGAIVYAVATFFAEPPRRPALAPTHRMTASRHESGHDAPARHIGRGTSHAKRPLLRPYRPAPGTPVSDDVLPERAGEIPVSAELARAADVREDAAPAAEPDAKAEPAAEEPTEGEAKPAAPAEAEPAAEPEPPAETPEPKNVTPKAKKPKAAKPADKSEPAEPTAVTTTEAHRPPWVEASPGLASSGVYAVAVHSGLFGTVPECQRELERAIKQTADTYIDDYLGDGAASVVDVPLGYLNEHVKRAEYAEVIESASVGPMHQIHALLEFDNQARADFHQRQRDAEVINRLWYTAGGAALVISLLTVVYGYLKLDLRTGGAHKGSLQLAATLVALIVAAGVLLVRWAVSF